MYETSTRWWGRKERWGLKATRWWEIFCWSTHKNAPQRFIIHYSPRDPRREAIFSYLDCKRDMCKWMVLSRWFLLISRVLFHWKQYNDPNGHSFWRVMGGNNLCLCHCASAFHKKDYYGAVNFLNGCSFILDSKSVIVLVFHMAW